MLRLLKSVENSPHRFNLYGLILVNVLTATAALAVFFLPIRNDAQFGWLGLPLAFMAALLVVTSLALRRRMSRASDHSTTETVRKGTKSDDQYTPSVRDVASSARQLRAAQDQLMERLIRKHTIDRQTFEMLAQMNICSSRMAHQLLQCEGTLDSTDEFTRPRPPIKLQNGVQWSVDQM